MSNVPENLLYSKDDEWVEVDGDNATIGITDYAQDALSDIVYLELNPSVDDEVSAEEVFGVVESVKAASDLIAPVSGTVTAVNEDLADTPEAINEDPYGSWMIKIALSDKDSLSNLMDAAAYTEYCQNR